MGNVSNILFQKPPNSIGIPTIVLYELEVGIAKSVAPEKRMQQLEALTATVTLLPFGINEVKFAATIRANLEKEGTPIGPYDVLIAATALTNNDILVTRNTKEFERIEGLQLENWF